MELQHIDACTEAYRTLIRVGLRATRVYNFGTLQYLGIEIFVRALRCTRDVITNIQSRRARFGMQLALFRQGASVKKGGRTSFSYYRLSI